MSLSQCLLAVLFASYLPRRLKASPKLNLLINAISGHGSLGGHSGEVDAALGHEWDVASHLLHQKGFSSSFLKSSDLAVPGPFARFARNESLQQPIEIIAAVVLCVHVWGVEPSLLAGAAVPENDVLQWLVTTLHCGGGL